MGLQSGGSGMVSRENGAHSQLDVGLRADFTSSFELLSWHPVALTALFGNLNDVSVAFAPRHANEAEGHGRTIWSVR